MAFPEGTMHDHLPCIGLNMSLTGPTDEAGSEATAPLAYIDAVEGAGGVPLCLPPFENIDTVRAILPFLDAFLFIGGRDYWPRHYGGHAQPDHELVDARRDRFDIAIADIILNETDLPVLGVCGGLQLLAIARGGALIQDIRTQWVPPQIKTPLPHAKDERRGRKATSFLHALTIRSDSLVARATGSFPATGLHVNSFHHQAVGPQSVGEDLCASAWSADGIIEALEPAPGSLWSQSGRFLLGVQWHPERMQDQPPQRRLFRSFIEAAAGRRP
ncbi:MAG: gamma-glutamyl-gamma-aminobutyrate hydrolase family protein [Pseudomonadota bacterium]